MVVSGVVSGAVSRMVRRADQPVTDRVTALVRVGVVTAMGVVVGVIAGGIFDRMLPVLLVAPLVAGAAAHLTTAMRPLWRSLALVVVAMAVTTVAAVVEGGEPADGIVAVVEGPRRLLTTEWPSPVEPTIVATVALLLAIATAAAAVLAGVRRWRFAPAIPIAAAAVVVLALGAPDQPPWWTVALLGAGVLALGLVPAGDALRHRSAVLLGDRTLAFTMVGIALAGVGTSFVVTADDRADPRRVEEADVTATVLDPLEATVALRRADPAIELFGITDRSPLVGRALPARWRIAALDVYDGQRWVPQLTLRPIGSRLGTEPELDPGDLPPITYEVVYRSDDLDLVPFPGRPLSVDAPVETDLDRVAVRLTERPSPGTTVTAVSLVAPTAGDVEAGALVEPRPIDEIARTFTDRARDLADDGDLIGQLRSIETTMRTEWILDREAPGGGQQLALLQRFVDETRRGTREQFVTAFVLLARSLGVEARVATGFVVPPDELTAPLVVDSTHATSWPEVRLADRGPGADPWLAFDPVPPRQEPGEDEPAPPPEAQSPAAAQPPIQPPADDPDDDEDRTTEVVDDRSRWDVIVGWTLRGAAVTSIGLLPLAVVVGTIVLLKWRRRRRRIRLTDPARRIRGAWANATDSLVDAGLTVRPAWTDDRIAVAGAPLAPTARHELRRLAAMAAAVTFGPRDDAWRLVDDAVATSRSIDDAVRTGRTRWQRIRWRLSLRSLRRRSRSPVVV